MELRIYYYENLLSLKISLFTKFLCYENLELYGMMGKTLADFVFQAKQ